MWYSTTSAGYCGDGADADRAGCTWRLAEVVKVVNKSCSDNAIYDEVEKVAAATDQCFSACEDSGVGHKRNTTSTCWIGCFYSTVLGPDAGRPGGEVTGLSLADLLVAWNRPFLPEDQ
eukprot:3909791-Prymnesium_polylepis.1